MAWDINIDATCTHLLKEDLVVEPDLMTFKLKRPALSHNIALFRNDININPDDTYYGWTVIFDKTSSSDFYVKTVAESTISYKRAIKLNNPLMSTDDSWTATYQTQSDYCDRCSGLTDTKDMYFDTSGNLAEVSHSFKLSQDLEKCVITQLGSNPYFAWYGTNLESYIGTPFYSKSSLPLIISEIYSAVDRLQKAQAAAIPYLNMTSDEKIKRIVGVDLVDSDEDSITLVVEVESELGKTITTEITTPNN